MHVHIYCAHGEAKFWLKPEIKLAKNYRLSSTQLREIERIIEEHYDQLVSAWRNYFQC